MSESASLLVDPRAIGARMREAREHLRFSQQGLADELNISKTGLQANEGGKSIPGGQLLAGLQALGISVDWLLSGEGHMLRSAAQSGAGQPGGAIDTELLALVMERVDQEIVARGRHPAPGKKAELVVLLYDYMVETGRKEGPSVERILRLVA
ncbi:helix-turn-helix domain-containing protein [Ralstonia solanacearum]|uniref:helix-turn-helix domain-containing protein n=1 Tax=Ralstonia solanacearum TaxID=305 RepID=UPI0009BBB510|nr:helix-turn-helix domain-containing protein [Ralstonia solanacearum]